MVTKSWKPEFCINGVWYDNAVRFATEKEAKDNAHDKFMVWSVPTDCRAVPSEDSPNYTYLEGRLEAIKGA